MGEPRPRVILADDYRPFLTSLARLLAFDCEVVATAVDGATLLEAAERLQPDIVVVDLNLAGISALDLCRRLRGDAVGAEVIVISADDSRDVRDNAGRLGALAFVAKHLAPDQLLPAIQNAMSVRRCAAQDRAGV